ncbi:hypothetical protein EDB81DRAFT_949605 [Dactylonectria macrodidyma]|uniref:F-box domain-containing protein n=1 Tax=Dactylonectria macrodidyma TaxID=307937 RepID=A0A9P9EA95_9HYPO|nr:hypothetical protein EDB81DRAFT_949605 [Dactylonectria macrodidyma]
MAAKVSSRELREKYTAFYRGSEDGLLDTNFPWLGEVLEEVTLREQPTKGLDELEVFPTEVLHSILFALDLNTFEAFRCLNRRALEMVEMLPEYGVITTHAPNAYLGALAITAGSWTTFRRLYEKHDHKTGNIFPIFMKLEHGALFDYQSIVYAAARLHGSFDAMNRYVDEQSLKRSSQMHQWMVRATEAREGVEPEAELPRRPPLGPYDEGYSNPLRFVAITRTPWFDKSTRKAEWGVNCLGCRNTSLEDLNFTRKFTEATFEEHVKELGREKAVHFVQCGRIRLRYRMSFSKATPPPQTTQCQLEKLPALRWSFD